MENTEILAENFAKEIQELLKKYDADIFGELGYGVIVGIGETNYDAILEKNNVQLEKMVK